MIRNLGLWGVLAFLALAAISVSLSSPLLAYRAPVYIGAGLAGVIAMALLSFQPVLANPGLTGASPRMYRHAHRLIGSAIVLAVILHVLGLWITSPPDVIDALTFTSPTPFSAWGVIAMWAVFASAFLAATRRKLRMRVRLWRALHVTLAVVIVVGTVTHAVLIEGTMGQGTKLALCAVVVIGTARLLYDRRRHNT